MIRSMILILSVGMALPAAAKPVRECRIRILRPVTDDMGHRWSAGRLLPATIMRRDANGVSFCAQGGSCVPRMTRNGRAAQLVNCRPGKALGNGDFRLDPNPARHEQGRSRQNAYAFRGREQAVDAWIFERGERHLGE